MTILCYACGGHCSGEVLKVQEKHYHINCFKCHECGCMLASGGYFPKNDKYYCSKDYHRLYGTRCKSCGDYVEGRVITALGNSYHPQCFSCDRCGGEIHSGTVVTYNDKEEILCENCSPEVALSDTPTPDMSSPSPQLSTHQTPRDKPNTVTSSRVRGTSNSSTPTTTYDEMFDFSKVPDVDPEVRPYLGKCAGCHDSIKSYQSLIALNRHWHLFCFSCNRCKRHLTIEYMDNGDQAYCEPCYQELYGLICETCQEYITGSVLEAGDRHYHPQCAYCFKCGERFAEGDDLYVSGEEVWHLSCDRTAREKSPSLVQSLPAGSLDARTKKMSPEIRELRNTSSTPSNAEESNIRRQLGRASTPSSRPSSRASSRQGRSTPEPHGNYPLKDLQLIGKVCLPKGVNRTKLELHLNEEDFYIAFGMDRNTFFSKPQWKQIELKKRANLF